MEENNFTEIRENIKIESQKYKKTMKIYLYCFIFVLTT